MMPVCTSDLGGTTPSDDGIEDDDGDDDTNSVIKTMNERVARYLQTYSLKRLLSVATEMHDEVRQTEEAIQTLVYENYTQFVSIIPAIRSTDFLQEDEVHARSAALVSDLRAFGKQRDGVLQHLWPVVKNSRKIERLHTLLVTLLDIARLPQAMERDIRAESYPKAVHRFCDYRDFLQQQADHFELFLFILARCDRLCRDAAQRLFEALQATADKEKSERGQEASFPIGTMEHLFNVVNALVRSNYFDKKKLASCWFRCCLPVLRASAESLLSKLCTSSSDHNFTPIPETGRAGVSKLRAFAEIVSIEIIPQLLDALESCRQLSGGISTEQLQHSVLLDTLRYCFSQILDFALTEDGHEESIVWTAETLRCCLEPLYTFPDVSRLFYAFEQNLASVALRSKIEASWGQYFEKTFLPFLHETTALCCFTIGSSLSEKTFVLSPSENTLFNLSKLSARTAQLFLDAVTLCLEECVPAIARIVTQSSELRTRVFYEAEYSVVTLIDTLEYCLDVYLDNILVSPASKLDGNETQLPSLIKKLTSQVTLYPMPSYTHTTALGVVLFLLWLSHNGVPKLRAALDTFFPTEETPDACRLPELDQQCQNMANELLHDVTHRWGRELTHFYQVNGGPCGELSEQRITSVPPDACSSASAMLRTPLAYCLMYEALRVVRIFHVLFGPSTSRVNPPLFLDSARHLDHFASGSRPDSSSEDNLHVEKLLTRHVKCVSLCFPPIPDPWLLVAAVARTAFCGILEHVREWDVLRLPQDTLEQKQFELIVFRDTLRFQPREVSHCAPKFHLYGWPVAPPYTTGASANAIFNLSDAFIKRALISLVAANSSNPSKLDMKLVVSKERLEHALEALKLEAFQLFAVNNRTLSPFTPVR